MDAREFDGRGDRLRRQPPRQHEWLVRVKAGDEPPVEGEPVAAGQRFNSLGRLGVEKHPVGDGGVTLDIREIGGIRDADGFHHGPAGPRPDRGDALRGFSPMQLDEIGIERRDDRLQFGVVRIDHERNAKSLAARAGREGAPLLQPDMARAFGKAHEPDHVGSGRNRGVNGVGRAQAADFDEGGHGFSLRCGCKRPPHQRRRS